MRVVVPFDGRRPKTRLADTFDGDERRAFAEVMLRDVLDAVRGAGGEPTVLSTTPLSDPVAGGPLDVPVREDDRALTPAINAVLAEAFGEDDDVVAVVMADLPLATPGAVERLFDADPDVDVTLVPGRGGGTNALLTRYPDFRVDYHGVSVRDHRRGARAVGARVGTVDSYRLSTDVDERADLVEVLLHGDGRAGDWLRDRGFSVVVDGQRRVRVRRETDG